MMTRDQITDAIDALYKELDDRVDGVLTQIRYIEEVEDPCAFHEDQDIGSEIMLDLTQRLERRADEISREYWAKIETLEEQIA
jgi:hypothetical protein